MGKMAWKNVSSTTNRWTRGVNNAADILFFYLLDYHHERASPFSLKYLDLIYQTCQNRMIWVFELKKSPL